MPTRFITAISCCLLMLPAIAQDPVAEEAPAQEQERQLSAASIASRADEVAAELLAMQKNLVSEDSLLAEITGELEELNDDLGQRLQAVSVGEASNLTKSNAEALVQAFQRMNRDIDEWDKRLSDRADFLEENSQLVRLELDFFTAILDQAAEQNLPESLQGQIRATIDKLSRAQQAILARLNATLDQLSDVSATRLKIAEASQFIDSTMQRLQRAALTFDRPPVWGIPSSDTAEDGYVARELQSRLQSAGEFVRGNEANLIAMFVLLLGIIALVFYARRPLASDPPTADSSLARERLVAARPVALAILLWAVVGPLIFLPPAPLVIQLVRGMIIAVCILRVLSIIMPTIDRMSVAAILVIYVASGFVELFPANDLLERAMLFTLGVVSIYFFTSYNRGLKQAAKADRGLLWHLGFLVSAVSPMLLLAANVGLIVGAVAFAAEIIAALPSLVLLLLAIIVIEDAANTAAMFFVRGIGGDWFRSMKRFPDVWLKHIAQIIRIALLVTFFAILPQISAYFLYSYRWFTELLATDLAVGTLAISFADVLVLIFSFVAAILIARLVRFVLDEDVFPRLSIDAGVASATSRLVYYTLVAAGIVFSLAASGVELSKLTLLISALGVGIGFGLQNVVNNFVSGLVLAFERPFKPGDIIEFGALTARVREIGLRASRVRTFDGAEVIVPNGDLIAGNVINWTLSDRMRRVDIIVGVAYGSDPAEVRAILLKVAADSEAVSSFPAPAALFNGFGESSLDFILRLWIPDAEGLPQINSDLNEAVNAALRDAHIVIPFPQRTLHIQDSADSAKGSD